MKFCTQDIINALDAVAPGISDKSFTVQANSFLFRNGKCYTFNGNIAVSTDMPSGWEVEAAVKAKELHRTLKKFKDEEVDVSISDNKFVVATSTTRLEVNTEADVNSEYSTIGSPDSWTNLPTDFNTYLTRVCTCVNENNTKPILSNIHIKGNIMEGCDNYRLLIQTMDSELPECLLPARAASMLIGYNATSMGTSNGWIHFKNGNNVVFSVRTMEATTYPALNTVVKQDGVAITLPETVNSGIAKAEQVLDKNKFNRIVFTAKNGVLVMTASGEFATVKERYKVDFKDEISFSINVGILRDVVKFGAACQVNETTLLVKSDNGKYIHVAALIRDAEAPKKAKEVKEEVEAPKAEPKRRKKEVVQEAPKAVKTEEDAW